MGDQATITFRQVPAAYLSSHRSSPSCGWLAANALHYFVTETCKNVPGVVTRPRVEPAFIKPQSVVVDLTVIICRWILFRPTAAAASLFRLRE